jgi:hypothetical protein
MLMRAPVAKLMDRNAYEFFIGRDAAGQPGWSNDPAERAPVFEDPDGVHLVSVAHAPGLGRFFLATANGVKNAGDMGIYDAAAPWGPWFTTYRGRWGAGEFETTTFFINFVPAWWSNGSKDFVAAFTGSGGLDSWNTVAGRFVLGADEADPGTGPLIAPDLPDATPNISDSPTPSSRARTRTRPSGRGGIGVSSDTATLTSEACRQIALNRGWSGIDAKVRDRRNARNQAVAIMRGQRFGDDRERRCTFDTNINDAKFDDQR